MLATILYMDLKRNVPKVVCQFKCFFVNFRDEFCFFQRGGHADRTFDHARKHNLHPVRAGGVDGAQRFADSAGFHHSVDGSGIPGGIRSRFDTFIGENSQLDTRALRQGVECILQRAGIVAQWRNGVDVGYQAVLHIAVIRDGGGLAAANQPVMLEARQDVVPLAAGAMRYAKGGFQVEGEGDDVRFIG